MDVWGDGVERAEIHCQGRKAALTPARNQPDDEVKYPGFSPLLLRRSEVASPAMTMTNYADNLDRSLVAAERYDPENRSQGCKAALTPARNQPDDEVKYAAFSPLLLRRSEVASPAITNDADNVDPSLVAAERYDPQSKAFSYVPAHSLQEHFNAPRKATKLIPIYDKLPNGDGEAARPPLPSSSFAALDTELLIMGNYSDPSYVPAHSSQEHVNVTRKATKLIPIYDKLPNGDGEAARPPLPSSSFAALDTELLIMGNYSDSSYVPAHSSQEHVNVTRKATKFIPLHDKLLTGDGKAGAPRLPISSSSFALLDTELLNGSNYGGPLYVPAHTLQEHFKVGRNATRLIPIYGALLNGDGEAAAAQLPIPSSSFAPLDTELLNVGNYVDPLYDTPSRMKKFQQPLHIQTPPCHYYEASSRRSESGGESTLLTKAKYRQPEYTSIAKKERNGFFVNDRQPPVYFSLTSSSKDWLERQMDKLKVRRAENDPDSRLRKQQERMLLDELKHVNDERRQTRSSEADYCVKGYGAKFVEPDERQFSREDIYSKIARDRMRRTPPPPLPARSSSVGNGEAYQPFSGVAQPSPKSILKKPKGSDAQTPTTSAAAEDYAPPPPANNKLRATTPAFPPLNGRAETPAPYHPLLYYQRQLSAEGFRSQTATPTPRTAAEIYYPGRRPSLQYLDASMETFNQHPVFVKDTSKYWYKPKISRDEAISMLREKTPGTFVIRDSNSFPGAFGLALKVAIPPPGVQTRSNDGTELVRHFLIEPTAKGVKLKGCNNEPVFGSLAALVYQHSITGLALPVKLILPDEDPSAATSGVGSSSFDYQAQNKSYALLEQGAACNVTYLFSCDVESLTGPEAVRRTVDRALFLSEKNELEVTNVHFKVASAGITLTDNTRRLFFRRHYPVQAVTFCGLDPDERRWNLGQVPKSRSPGAESSARIFGFVAKKCPANSQNAGQICGAVSARCSTNQTENVCHVFAEFEPEQPASAIVNFVTKVMMASFRSSHLQPANR